MTDLYQRLLFDIHEIAPYIGFGLMQFASYMMTLWFSLTFNEPRRGLVRVAQLQVFSEVLHLALLVFYTQISENIKMALPGNHFFRSCRGVHRFLKVAIAPAITNMFDWLITITLIMLFGCIP